MTPTTISGSTKQRVREASRHRCGYCLSPQQYVLGKLEIEHIIPRARSGSNEESNLWLSCSLCNRFKGSKVTGVDPLDNKTVALFNPRTQVWNDHFRWSRDATRVIGLTAHGRATVEALQLNHEVAVEVRRNWILAGWHPPSS